MPRSSPRTQRADGPRVPAHPQLLEVDLAGWAGERTARNGRREALLGRVEWLKLEPGGAALDARVRGNRPLPYRVSVRAEDGGPDSRCTCAGQGSLPCKHAVAALEALRFPLSEPSREGRSRRGAPVRGRGKVIQSAPPVAGFIVLGQQQRMLTRQERIDAARSEELLSRQQRARLKSAAVRLHAETGKPPHFDVTPRAGEPPATVTLRGPDLCYGSCTCSDFLSSELQACQHLERVRRWYLRKKKHLPTDVCSVWCHSREWPDRVPDPLREIRIELPQRGDGSGLQSFFDGDGWLREAPASRRPSAWAREAVTAALQTTRRNAWSWDLDPMVEQRIEIAGEAETTRRLLGAADGTTEVWRRLARDLGFRLHPYQERGALFLARRGYDPTR